MTLVGQVKSNNTVIEQNNFGRCKTNQMHQPRVVSSRLAAAFLGPDQIQVSSIDILEVFLMFFSHIYVANGCYVNL